MGNNNCNTIEQAFTRNQCSYGYKDTSFSITDDTLTGGTENTIYNFCTTGSTTSYAKDWCTRVGSNSGEWVYTGHNGGKGDCRYDSCHPYNVAGKGCCNGCCGNKGYNIKCQRDTSDEKKAFKGDPISCCFKDYNYCKPTIRDGVFGNSTDTSGCFSGASDDDNCTSADSTGKDCAGTCNPCQRDVTSNENSYFGDVNSIAAGDPNISDNSCGGHETCADKVLQYCTGSGDTNDASWIYRWMNEDGTPVPRGCLYALARNAFYEGFSEDQLKGGTTNRRTGTIASQCAAVTQYFTSLEANESNCKPISPFVKGEKYDQAVALVAGALKNYQAAGYVFGSIPGSQGYNPFQDFIYKNVFCPFPSIANDVLSSTCRQYTIAQLEKNPTIANMCGCFLADEEYYQYTNVYQINPECSPMCNRPNTVPRTNFIGQPYYCNQDTCIIDDVAINLSKSEVGQISINQMCGNCHTIGQPTASAGAGASCNCSINGLTYQAYGSDLDSINVGEQCTTQNCTVYNSVTQQSETMPCSEVSNQQNIINQQEKLKQQQREEAVKRRTRNIMIFFGILIGLLLIIGYFMGPVFKDLDDPTPPEKPKIIIAKPKPQLAPMGSTKEESYDTMQGGSFSQESYFTGESTFGGDSFGKSSKENNFGGDIFGGSSSFGSSFNGGGSFGSSFGSSYSGGDSISFGSDSFGGQSNSFNF
jgi:hypothetical protein